MPWHYLLYNGIFLGLAVAVPIGPINIEIARRTLRQSQRAGLTLGLGAVSGDVTWSIITGLALLPFLRHQWLLRGLGIAGGVFLVYLAYLCLRSASKTHEMGEGAAISVPLRIHFRTGFLMALLSPYNLIFWLVSVPATVATLTRDPRRDLPWVAAGVAIGAFSWCAVFSTIVHHIGRL
jgi:threonine/homoserine/homoserine lactone efflux protein